jgi:septal ring factor EnvC (AmiA/AmiB activator)
MTSIFRHFFLALAMIGMATAASAQRPLVTGDKEDARTALARALAEQKAAQARSHELEQAASKASAAADRTSARAAALAARIQQSEAGIFATEARLQLIERSRSRLRSRLAERQRPLVQLTAALQNLSRRPPALSLLRPVSVREMVYLRVVLASTLPEVTRRTAGLRAEIARLKVLRGEARRTILALRKGNSELQLRRNQLAALETRQRLDSRAKTGIAAREADRALAMAEEARDLDGLLAGLDGAARLRARLAALPGPVMRPLRPQDARSPDSAPATVAAQATGAPRGYRIPVVGPIVTGFGAVTSAGVRSAGLTLAPRASAQIVAPAAGRVAFAGAYRGYGRIVIIEHEGGWTSLLTGLARVDARVGQQVLGGSPLGIAGVDRPSVTLELRRDGETVNPLEYL